MSDPVPQQSMTVLESYTQKLNIGLGTTEGLKRLINRYARDPRIVICAVGMPGVGKSQGTRQAAEERGVPFPAGDEDLHNDTVEDLACPSQVIHIPQMQVEDFYLPTKAHDGNPRYYDRRIPRRFQAVIEYAKKYEKEIKAGTKGRPILLIEEPNRARDKSVTAALFTLIEDRMIGDTHLSPLVQMVCLMNPSNMGMNVNQFEKDLASRRRLLFVGVTTSFSEFIHHAVAKEYHPKVIEFLKARPDLLYDYQAALAGQIYACPASWQTTSDILKTNEAEGAPLIDAESRLALPGKIGMTVTEALRDFITNKAASIAPQDVIDHYTHGSEVRRRVLDLRDTARHDHLITLCRGVASILFLDQKDPDTYDKTLGLFMEDLPADMLMAFVTSHMAAESKVADANRKYWIRMNQEMARLPAFNGAMAKLQAARTAAAEAMKAANKPETAP